MAVIARPYYRPGAGDGAGHHAVRRTLLGAGPGAGGRGAQCDPQSGEQRMTMVIVTHEMDFTMSISHRVIFMKDGKVQLDGAPQVIRQDAAGGGGAGL